MHQRAHLWLRLIGYLNANLSLDSISPLALKCDKPCKKAQCYHWWKSKKLAFFGTLSQGFRPLIFFHQTTPSGPLLHGFVFEEIFDYEIDFFGGQRSQWHRWPQKWSLVNPHIFCMNVVQFAYVWFFDRNSLVPLVPWSAVSILVRGVINTAHQWSAVPVTPLTTKNRCS
jgi:hypothetical protein